MSDRDAWDSGWAGAERFRLERALAATPAERLAWLEEAIVLAWRTGALPREEDEGSPSARQRSDAK